MRSVNCEVWGRERLVCSGARTAGCARVKNESIFFVFTIYSTPLTESVWFGWGFFGSETETEPKIFLKNLIGLIGFFYGSIFLVIFFSV